MSKQLSKQSNLNPVLFINRSEASNFFGIALTVHTELFPYDTYHSIHLSINVDQRGLKAHRNLLLKLQNVINKYGGIISRHTVAQVQPMLMLLDVGFTIMTAHDSVVTLRAPQNVTPRLRKSTNLLISAPIIKRWLQLNEASEQNVWDAIYNSKDMKIYDFGNLRAIHWLSNAECFVIGAFHVKRNEWIKLLHILGELNPAKIISCIQNSHIASILPLIGYSICNDLETSSQTPAVWYRD